MYKIGHSIDIHPLKKKRKLIIGGVDIPYKKGLFGHSDADVLFHAIAEAIIGALGQGDLGHHFSDLDPKNKDLDSSIIMDYAFKLMEKDGFRVNNLDALVMIEEPKLSPFIKDMKKNIASLLHTDIENINIKATRGEKLGFIGHKKGALASATILLIKKDE